LAKVLYSHDLNFFTDGLCVKLKLGSDKRRIRAKRGLGTNASAPAILRTFAMHQPISALPPKADMWGAKSNVCFGQ
jgi:hypothetical protein